ncbi:glycoside hydrolase family 5 protein [Collybiopsis luxurians FD-317 M1]|uniref:cellulase n=1 Tax=Collybiopsis luxurians FD-317 M1 TaxID=944289 RepID=A0A0D0CU59_9AGAR|nr:glycoside hydrolase family 5 protein [Collybiopsis luxurians FD-317 M1]
MKLLSSFASLAVSVALSTSALAQSPIWGQCGGIGWTGSTTCASGSSCVVSNPYYSQCLPGSSGSSPTTSSGTSPTSTSSGTAPSSGAGTCTGTRTKFKFFGVNESGAEFGNTVIPGTLGKDYTWPDPNSISFFIQQGFNFFRLPFLLERLCPPATGITGPFDPNYFGNLSATVNEITSQGAYVAIEPHNYLIYNGATLSSTSDFQTFWKNLAGQFKTNSHVIFDLMNEPYQPTAQVVYGMMQAGVNGVRSSGATSQLILVEGTSWTGAWTWTSSGNAAAFTALTDPNNNVAIEMHQYLDSDGSGTSATCVSNTIGVERLADATAWLQSTGFKGFLGEIGAGSNTACIQAVFGALCSMQEAGGAWIGASWWAAGPWWSTYFQSIEPPSGAAIPSILPQALEPFL